VDREQRPKPVRRAAQRRRRRFARQLVGGQSVAPGAVGVPEHAPILAAARTVLEKGVRVRSASPGRRVRRTVGTTVHDPGGSLVDARPQRRSAGRVVRRLYPEVAREQRPVSVVGVVPLAVPV